MLADLLTMMTEAVRGWWLAIAASPWLSLLVAAVAVLLLPAAGFAIGRIAGRRRAAATMPDSAAALVSLREAEAAMRQERDDALADVAEAKAALLTHVQAVDGRDAAAQVDREDADAARAALASVEAALTAREAELDAARSALDRAEAATEAARLAETKARDECDSAREQVRLVERRTAEAEARAASAEQRAAAADATAHGDSLIRMAEAVEGGEAGFAEALAEADRYCAMHGAGIAALARLRALAALGPGGDGIRAADKHLTAARSAARALPPAVIEDLDVLEATIAAAAHLGGQLGIGPRAAIKAGLPRLAEIRWLHEADAAGEAAVRGTALAGAADAALWGGRWPQAAALAARAVDVLQGQGEDAAILGARLTQAQARFFAGAADGSDLVSAIAEDAAAALGASHPVTASARRLAARAAFERGDVDAGEAAAALLSGSAIDPTTDPAIRAARARGLMVSGKLDAARGIFEALARQAAEGSRAALGHRLDALEVRLADDDDPASLLQTLEELTPQVESDFGPRHPRTGQAALLKASLCKELGDTAGAVSALSVAEAILSLRLDPAHRWREAADNLHRQLTDGDTMAESVAAAAFADAARQGVDAEAGLPDPGERRYAPDGTTEEPVRRGPLVAEDAEAREMHGRDGSASTG
jgi:hypothetical protein